MPELTGTYMAYTCSTTTNTFGANIIRTEAIHCLPKQGEIVVRVCATSLNPVDVQLAGVTGTDKTILSWFGGWGDYKGKGVELAAKVPGADFSGVVAAVGEEIGNMWRVGDEVFGVWLSPDGNSTNQEYITLPAHAPIVFKPTYLSHVEAASLPLAFLISYTSLVMHGGLDRHSEVNTRREAKVLIVGASGGTGIIGVQMAKSLGAKVIAVCCGDDAEFVKSHGADEVIDSTTQDVPSIALSYGPFKVIYDCVGGTQLIPHLSALAPTRNFTEPHYPALDPGTYVTIVGDNASGMPMGGNISYLTSPSMLFRSIKGQVRVGPKYYCVNLTTGEEELRALTAWVRDGRVKPVIDGEPWGWGKLGEAYGRPESGGARGKVVVDWTKE